MRPGGATGSPPSPTRGRGRAQRIRLGLFLALGLLALDAPEAAAQDLATANRALSELEADAQRLLADPVRPLDLKSETFVEERLTDGELYLRLEDYLRAAILLTDIVEHYPTHRAYPEALFLLGESLFLADDYLGARRRYAQVIDRGGEPAFSPYLQPSLSRLIQIAIHTHDFRDVDSYFSRLDAIPSSTLSISTAYFRAKYLYNRALPIDDVLDAPSSSAFRGLDQGRLEQARKGFLGIPSGTEFSLRAKYFVGTIHTFRGEYLDAIAAFRGVMGHEPANEQEAEVLELTYLALGRLYYETEQLEQAVEAYRAVEQTSARFDQALFELAWTYIRMGDAIQAERTLEVLSVAAPNSPLNADGKVLRGDLLARNGRYDEAEVVFDEVRATFGPIRDELEAKRNDHPDLHAHFRAVVRENLDDFDIDDFLPESARRWIELEGDYERALEVLSDLSEANRLVEETNQLAERITAALSAPNRVSVFADLRRQRERTTGLRNRAARALGALIEAESQARGAPAGQAAPVRTRRREVQAEVMDMPVDTEDFVDRDMERLGEFRAAERDLQALRIEILGLEARIVASRAGLPAIDPRKADPQALATQLAEHEGEIEEYEEQLTWIRRRLEVGRLHVGVGDRRYQADDVERRTFIDLVGRERKLTGSGGPQYDEAFSRVAALERRLDQRDAELTAVVKRRVTQMLATVDDETANLKRYRNALGSLEGEAEDVVGAITYLNFNRVHDRFYDLVLRAEVGKIDVAWARREDHRVRIDTLTRERARELQALDDEFRDVMDENQGVGGGP
ncbi:MAG: tetratricopeptide repeat protein [Deltaproteobacteria bacterium]|nr:MAG: tetratricopeptide repeat protein [Deltaproteobacteria bacterium]